MAGMQGTGLQGLGWVILRAASQSHSHPELQAQREAHTCIMNTTLLPGDPLPVTLLAKGVLPCPYLPYPELITLLCVKQTQA